MIISDVEINCGKLIGISDHMRWSEIRNTKIYGKIDGTLYNVQFDNCVFKDAVFELENSTDVTFVECRFENCLFKRATGVSFILCKNSMNGIRFK